ncbi:MAG: DUF4375 domain-containing protein [Paracoccaceae bacterium]
MPGFVVQTPTAFSRSAKPETVAQGPAQENAELWDMIRPLNDAMNIALGEDEYHASVARFSEEQRAAHAVMWYVSDVQNGGHWQFFYNSTGILWQVAQRGLRKIGANKAALTLSGAALRAGGSPPFDLASRQSLMQRLSPKFADLDAEINALDPLAALQAYVDDNSAAFRAANPNNA